MKILLIGGCGYIGSVLYGHLTDRGHEVESIDLERRGNPALIPNRSVDYGSLTSEDLAPFDTVILLAAHASVAEAAADPHGAFVNNVVSFHSLLAKLGGRRLIYASSSSVYTGLRDVPATEASQWYAMGNLYDFSKFIDDGLAILSGARCYGLRFGTVNGTSPNMRHELMFNRMVQTAVTEGYVRISNVHVHRPILAMKDLARAVAAIVEGARPPGVYNLASFNTTVLEAGAAVSRLLDAPIRMGPDSPTYDFTLDTEKFSREFGFSFDETHDKLISDIIAFYESGRRAGSSIREADA